MKHFVHRLAWLASTVAVIPAGNVALADTGTQTFDIPSQSLTSALLELSRQSQVMILVAPETARDYRANALRGQFSVDKALSVLLRGSGLRATPNPNGGYIIGPGKNKAAAAEQPGLTLAATRPEAAAQAINTIQTEAGEPGLLESDTVHDSSRVEEIVVTAQKREQSLQDVPIAISAFGEEALAANRVTSIMDLGNLAPNVTVVSATGGSGLPLFAIRGQQSSGNAPSQDRVVGLYLDGVALAGAAGLTFDLPALERIEVLRGPQGTLFGRNSTAGAVSIVTKDPSGQFGLRQQLSYGNYNQFRVATTVETPEWGPFSALVSYVHNEREGDIKNLGAGTVWDRSLAGLGRDKSPDTLGAENAESFFAAVKFQPSDKLKVVYKYDNLSKRYTPEGIGLVAFTSTNPVLTAAYLANPVPMSLYRPKSVNNDFIVPSRQKTHGHNVTASLEINENLSFKNIFGYRKNRVQVVAALTGLGGLKVNGDPLVVSGQQQIITQKQWSNELQLNFSSDLVTLTAGAIYFKTSGLGGAPFPLLRTTSRTVIPGGVFPAAPQAANLVKADAWAGYVQGEFHVVPDVLDVVGGYRLTQDRKHGVNIVADVPYLFSYNDTRPSYLIGVNANPTRDILLYAKYSTGFVAGGSVAGIEFLPETVKSWEGGMKGDFFDRRLRFNLALFQAKYTNSQGTTQGSRLFPPRPTLGVVVATLGNLKTKGVEMEVTAVPVDGLTLSGSLGYTDYSLTNINQALFCPAGCTGYRPPYRAKATGTVGVQYETPPLFGDARLLLRADGNWRSKMLQIARLPIIAGHEALEYSPAGWLVNGRAALRNIAFSDAEAEIAIWGKNIFDNDRFLFVSSTADDASTLYEKARTFGVDVTFKY